MILTAFLRRGSGHDMKPITYMLLYFCMSKTLSLAFVLFTSEVTSGLLPPIIRKVKKQYLKAKHINVET